jgi:peptidoglycan/xylan/chitin deacetylase (PgdA/CDA1 family)
MCFELDDWPQFQFNFDPPRHGLATPSAVLEIWHGELEWMDANVDRGVLTVCMHPQVIGRAHRVAMLDRFIEAANALGAEFLSLGEVATGLTQPG